MGLLADTFRTLLVTFLQSHNPTRVLVGGLPDFLIERIALSWNSSYSLFLVSNTNLAPLPVNVQRCRADDLTAERQHGWAALLSSHESRGIQESIRSAGAGTVRELWPVGFPWRPCELPGARWIDVRNGFIDALGLGGARKEVADCIDQFREELRGEVDAAIRFYGALDALAIAGISYDDVCFQLGFPKHSPGRTLRKKGDKEAVLSLLDAFVERFKDDVVDEAQAQLLDVAQTRYSGDVAKKAAVESALKFFSDEFRHIQPADAENPVRAWRTVFENHRPLWETLATDVLIDLLGPSNERPSFAEYILKSGPGIELFDVGENRLIVRDRNASAPAVNGEFEFKQGMVTQAAQAATAGTPWILFSRVNRVFSQLVSPLPPGKGPYQYAIPLPGEGKQSMRFLVGPNSNSERAISKATTVWECCQDYPLIVASSHAKLRAGKRRRSKDDVGNTRFDVEQSITLPAQGRVVLHGFIYRLQGPLEVILPGESASTPVLGLTPIPNSLCQQFVLNVDAVEGAEINCAWSDASSTPHRATIDFDFKGEVGPRDDSMTGVLLRAHGGAGAKQLKAQLRDLKSGNQIPAGELSVKETSKPIALWEQHQQNVERGWWPIVATYGRELGDQNLQVNTASYIFISSALSLNEQANAWRSVVESSTPMSSVPAEITTYVEARTELLNSLAQQFDLAQGELIDEVNLSRKAAIGLLDRPLLQKYIQSYSGVLKATKGSNFPSDWRWYSWSVDSVLLFAPDATGPTAHLLGPFHPVTLARLYFLQECLGERLLDDEPSALAHVLAQVQPLTVGHVIDAQLQSSHAIAFPTGEPHWLWVYRQQGQSNLPEETLVEWLRQAGLDPQTGPLGVDAEVLPQTLKQYILAYPSHQTLRLSLEDCSQRTFEVLRDELLPGEGANINLERLRVKLPGGISVYDPVTKVKRLDGELLSYDPELPLRWHHASPPGALTIDLATLPRSNRVDLQAKQRGGACSAPMPTARRGVVEFTSAGLEVATVLSTPVVVNDLQTATVELLSEFEPVDQQLSWGTSLSMTGGPNANWTLCSAGQVDPRLFIEYVRRHPGTALWTYRLFSLGETKAPEFGRGHFLIARVSNSLASGLQTQLTGTGLTVLPNELLTELAQAGLTLGDEFLRTGRTAEGALGQYLVERLVWQPAGNQSPLPHWTTGSNDVVESAGFLLQVDPFSRVLDALPGQAGGVGPADSAVRQRSDLVSIHLQFCGEELWIRPVVLESKFRPSGQHDIENALSQAVSTATQFDHLLEFCLHDKTKPHDSFWAQPERLLLTELIHLGLRLSRGSFNGNADEWPKFERRVLSKVLSGDFRRDNAKAIAVVHYGGPTIDNLATDRPHALISFSDTNAARTASAPSIYQEIQQTLGKLLRHICGLESDAAVPSLLTTLTEEVTSPEQPVTEEGQAETFSPTQPEQSTGETNASATDIAQAHAAFDAAFADFIGNRRAIEKLRDDLVDALIKRPPHLPSAYLLTGNPSTGKTTLANKVAKLLGVTFVKLVGTNIRNEADLVKHVDSAFQADGKQPKIIETGSQGLPEYEYPECLIFIDEIHLVKGRAQEGLLTLTEPKDRYLRLSDRICLFPRATYMAATTRDSEIDRALRTRFGNPIHLIDYNVAEVAEMLRVKSDEWALWSEGIRSGLARLARCIPREAERLAQKLQRKITVSRELLTLDAALEKLRLEEGLDRNGLDEVCWNTLRQLAKQKRPVGRETLAKQLGSADEEKINSEIIPALQALELVEQVAGGQIITDRGRNYLRNEAAPTSN
jgi:Holliday junction resolvasome RuvABC ATP-dependent DNA helicase subunit